MKQLRPRLIASISNSHLQNRLSDVHIGSPLPQHDFWRWSRCGRVTCSYQSQVVLLITVMLAAQVFWDTFKPRERNFLSVGVGWGGVESWVIGASEERDKNFHWRLVWKKTGNSCEGSNGFVLQIVAIGLEVRW